VPRKSEDIPVILVQRVARRAGSGSNAPPPHKFQKPFVVNMARLQAAVAYLQQFDTYWAEWKLPQCWEAFPKTANGDVAVTVPYKEVDYDADREKVGQLLFERWCSKDLHVVQLWRQWLATSEHAALSNWNALRREVATWAVEEHGDRFRNIRGWDSVNLGWIAACLADRLEGVCADDIFTEYTAAQILVSEDEDVVDGGGAEDDAGVGDAVAADEHLAAELDALVQAAEGRCADPTEAADARASHPTQAADARRAAAAPLVAEPVQGKVLDEDTYGLFPNMFPKIYTNIAGCFNSDRSDRAIDFYDYVRHVSLSTNGRAMRHPRWRYYCLNRLARADASKSRTSFLKCAGVTIDEVEEAMKTKDGKKGMIRKMICFSTCAIGSLEEKKYQRRDLEAFVNQKQAETLHAARSGPPRPRRPPPARRGVDDDADDDVEEPPSAELQAGELPAIFLTLTSAPTKWEHLDRLIQGYYNEYAPHDENEADSRDRRPLPLRVLFLSALRRVVPSPARLPVPALIVTVGPQSPCSGLLARFGGNSLPAPPLRGWP